MTRARLGPVVLTAALLAAVPAVSARQAPALAPAIDKLGAFDFAVRSAAARELRRAPAADALPVLLQAVTSHADSYVQFKALVLAAGIGGAPVEAAMRRALTDRNSRVRAAAYAWYETHPAPDVLPVLLAALPDESSEFVRPALTRALAAHAGDPRVRAALEPLILSGEDFFRGEVIDALGDHDAAWARDAILRVAALDGPLQDDAVLAAGKIGGAGVAEALARLQRTVLRERQPAISAAFLCLGIDAPAQRTYLSQTLAYASDAAGAQLLLRAVTRAAGAAARHGDAGAFDILLAAGPAAVAEAVRAPLALALGAAAVRQPEGLLAALGRLGDTRAALALLRDAFDMLDEDFAEELFYAHVRKAYWAAPDGSPARRLAGAVIDQLEF